MARGKKTGGRNFAVGNPGPPFQPEELKKAKKLNKEAVIISLNKFLNWELKDLMIFAKNDKNTVLDMYIARVLVKGISEGDTARLNFLFDRLIGKVKEVTEIQTPKPTVMRLLDGRTEIIMGATIVKKDESDENNS